MGPVRQNPIHRTVSLFICVCIALCTIVAHNIAQNRPDSFPPYPPDNHHCSVDVYLREGGSPEGRTRGEVWCLQLPCISMRYACVILIHIIKWHLCPKLNTICCTRYIIQKKCLAGLAVKHPQCALRERLTAQLRITAKSGRYFY